MVELLEAFVNSIQILLVGLRGVGSFSCLF